MDYKEKLALAKKNFDEAKAILGNKDASAEDKNKIEPLITDAKKFQAEAMQLKDIDEFGKLLVEEKEIEQPPDKEKEDRKDKKEFKNWGDYLHKVWLAGHPNPSVQKLDPRLQGFKEEREPGHEKKDLAEGTGAGGGFLVPSEFNANLLAAVGENSIIRQRATVIRMARRQLEMPVLDQTTTTAGVPHWFGGMRFYWEEEAGQKSESDPAFRKVTLVANKLIGYTRASDELVDDSAISLDDFFSGPFGMAGGIAWMEDFAFLRGTGAGQPLGVLNAGATIGVARGQTDINVKYEGLVNMLDKFLPSGRGVWVASQSLMSDLLTMNGPTGNPSYLWGSAVTGVPSSLLGLPIIFTEKSPAAGSAGDILLADFRYYLIGDRQATTIESTKFDRWQYDQTSWRAVHRVDGQPWLSAPLTLQDGTSTYSPFVQLVAEST